MKWNFFLVVLTICVLLVHLLQDNWQVSVDQNWVHVQVVMRWLRRLASVGYMVFIGPCYSWCLFFSYWLESLCNIVCIVCSACWIFSVSLRKLRFGWEVSGYVKPFLLTFTWCFWTWCRLCRSPPFSNEIGINICLVIAISLTHLS